MRPPDRVPAPGRRSIRDMQTPTLIPGAPLREAGDTADVSLTFDDNRLTQLVLGQFDQNLAKIERRLGVRATANGNHIAVRGTARGLRGRRGGCWSCSTSA